MDGAENDLTGAPEMRDVEGKGRRLRGIEDTERE